MRGLAASSATLLQTYEDAYADGEGAFAAAIAKSLPLEGDKATQTAAQVAAYLGEVMQRLRAQGLAEIEAGRLGFPEIVA
jgi:hypothetical protein